MGGSLGCHRSIPKDPTDFSNGKHKLSTACNFGSILMNQGGSLGCHRSIPPKDRTDFSNGKPKFSTAHNFGSMLMNQDRVDINTATEEELMTLPGVNRTVAQNIVGYRNCIGGYKKVEDLALVDGIGGAKLEVIKVEICVSSRSSSTPCPHCAKTCNRRVLA
ncbi:endonuclease/exonuclease/phosphatase family domain-containing protein 1 [Syngnathus acus]|uniref:endonuclease/exonuclease/phosphatase family domain-containing protein 1 n=1 Tax=Syngnathus acus TaxID=161584 RepID=UPI001885BD96|nr:endonuclease/exonuclease/phosphatase family domain-containing protein 1 [Syngnathus acus]XP_037119363.1 endonuclease/exonuclease/phosphatase family domain-containing protein 1 [Syngnathus acus]